MINTGGVLDSGELRESVLHQHMDGFDFCVGREPLFHYAVITLHRRDSVCLIEVMLDARCIAGRTRGSCDATHDAGAISRVPVILSSA